MQETHIDEAFKQQSKSRAILLSLLVVAVGVAVVLGIVLTKDGEKSGKENISPIQSETETPVEETETPSSEPMQNSDKEFWETGIVEILGEALPADIDLGYTAPAFKAQPNNSAETITIDPADGTVRLIGFFAHWCPHCQREVPRVANWLAENGFPAEIEIIAISTAIREDAPNYPPSDWFRNENWPGQVLVDNADSDLATAYGITGFPYWVLVDATGTVVHRSSGELTEEQFGYLVDLAVSLTPQVT